jgi:hypothetical protein
MLLLLVEFVIKTEPAVNEPVVKTESAVNEPVVVTLPVSPATMNLLPCVAMLLLLVEFVIKTEPAVNEPVVKTESAVNEPVVERPVWPVTDPAACILPCELIILVDNRLPFT